MQNDTGDQPITHANLGPNLVTIQEEESVAIAIPDQENFFPEQIGTGTILKRI